MLELLIPEEYKFQLVKSALEFLGFPELKKVIPVGHVKLTHLSLGQYGRPVAILN